MADSPHTVCEAAISQHLFQQTSKHHLLWPGKALKLDLLNLLAGLVVENGGGDRLGHFLELVIFG